MSQAVEANAEIRTLPNVPENPSDPLVNIGKYSLIQVFSLLVIFSNHGHKKAGDVMVGAIFKILCTKTEIS